MGIESAKLIPWFPAIAAALCGLFCASKPLRKLASWTCALAIFAGFAVTFSIRNATGDPGSAGTVLKLFEWIHVGDFKVDFAYYIDSLTIIMLSVICGIGTLVAWYAGFYMSGDRGYARFFAAVSLFIFSMTTLVMADNLVLLYLGWEGVGLCSYMLIGYYYDKPSAVAAAKKAFIVNRIGDLGFALGIFLTYTTFGTVQYQELFAKLSGPALQDTLINHDWAINTIPFLLMLGAFGKSAQLPLYIWLPDAMEGPTPVSALIHAATMVTAGVYMIARLFPLFELSPNALPTVAVVGGCTAIFAATIALCQYDIKRIYAYSTISQLGYMFMGIGLATSTGAVFHLFTHAFFKALLFLTAGSVMHGLAGQLDLRKMSGLRTKMPVTCWLMFVGCLALAGFPGLAGFFSKDMILAHAFERGLTGDTLARGLGIMGLITAFLTAFYTFRLWFRVFMGPTSYEMGHEHHGSEDDHGHAKDDAHGGAAIKVEHHHDAHEMPLLMNLPLVVLAIGAIVAGFACEHWINHMIQHSSAAAGAFSEHAAGGDHHGPSLLGTGNLHQEMMLISSIVAIAGIGLAAYYHWLNRTAADRVAAQYPAIVQLLANKYYVDEILMQSVVRPLRLLGEIFFIVDSLIIAGIVDLVGAIPGEVGRSARSTQKGNLQGYGLGMALGAAVIVLLFITALR